MHSIYNYFERDPCEQKQGILQTENTFPDVFKHILTRDMLKEL